jgi:hypothetical protein
MKKVDGHDEDIFQKHHHFLLQMLGACCYCGLENITATLSLLVGIKLEKCRTSKTKLKSAPFQKGIKKGSLTNWDHLCTQKRGSKKGISK